MTNPLVDVVAALVGVHDLDDERLALRVRTPRYESLLRVAADCVEVGTPVVLVAPYTSERRDRAAWRQFAETIEQFGGRAELVWLRISRDDLTARIANRAADRDSTKLLNLAAYVQQLDLKPPVSPHLEADASLKPAVQAAIIVRLLEGPTNP